MRVYVADVSVALGTVPGVVLLAIVVVVAVLTGAAVVVLLLVLSLEFRLDFVWVFAGPKPI